MMMIYVLEKYRKGTTFKTGKKIICHIVNMANILSE